MIKIPSILVVLKFINFGIFIFSVKRIYSIIAIILLASFISAQPYTPLHIEPVANCQYADNPVMYSEIPSSPYIWNQIYGQLAPTSQFFNTLPPPQGQPQGSFYVQSACDSQGDLVAGVCGYPINYPGYGGIVSINRLISMPLAPSSCVTSSLGSFFAYTFGSPNVTSDPDLFNTNSNVVINQFATSSSVTISTTSFTGGMVLIGPLPSNNVVGGISCMSSVTCAFTATVPRPQGSATSVYHIYRDMSGSLQNLDVYPIVIT